MSTRPVKITFAAMHASGMRGLLVYCCDYKCSHSLAISGDPWPDDARLSDIESRFVCTARGMTNVARASGLSRENLYRCLSASQNANFGTVLRVAGALGYELQFKPKRARAAPITFLAADSGKPRKVGSGRAKKAVTG
jgi:hypothetical protein